MKNKTVHFSFAAQIEQHKGPPQAIHFKQLERMIITYIDFDLLGEMKNF